MASEKTPKNPKKFTCQNCDFVCINKKDYTRHLSTRKHKMLVNTSTTSQKTANNFKCICGKSYKHDSSYYKHKKTCTFINEEEENNNGGNNEKLVEKLLEDNAEMRGLIKEIIHKIGNTKKVIKNIAKEVIVDKENE